MRIGMFLELSTVHLSPAAIRTLDETGRWSGDYRDDPETGLCQRPNGPGQAHRWVNASTAVATVIPFEYAWFLHALPDRECVLGPDHPDTLITRSWVKHWQCQAPQ